MVLWVISDAAYLVEPQSQSIARKHFFLGENYMYGNPQSDDDGAILNKCEVMQNVMAAASKA